MEEAGAAAQAAPPPPPQALLPQAAPPPPPEWRVQLLPCYCAERPFATHAARCSPSLTDYVAFRRLLSTAREVLCEGLSEELCSRSTGFLPDTAVDAERKTVALLLDVRGNVAAALVYSTDLGRVAAQVLVAGTSAKHRQKGCMRRLLAAVRAQLITAGLSELCLAVARGNDIAARCWAALGFYAAGCWPTRFSPVQTSSDLGTIFRLELREVEPRKRRWAAVSEPAPALARGAPASWPPDVPFVSHCGLPAGVPPSMLPKLHQPALVVRATEEGGWGLFARRALVPGYPLCCFGGEIVRVIPTQPGDMPPQPAVAPRVTLEGGLLELSAARCGNECRFLRLNVQRSNAHLQLRYDPLTGAALVLLCLVRPVHAGERIELADWTLLPRRHRSSAKRRARRIRC